MKKTILVLVMATLCLFLRVTGQTPIAKPPLPAVIKQVRIGDRIPEILLTKVHNYKSSTMNLADLKAKLIIIDFWATWCSPCVAMIPKMDSLQKEFKHDVQFISVSYQSEKEVTTFMEMLEKQRNVNYSIPYSTDDNLLRFMFPHKSLPHYVWISGNGTVKAITELKEITSANIDKMLSNDSFTLPEKNDITISYDNEMPFLVNGNGGDGKQLIYHSVLTGYVPGLTSHMYFQRTDKVHINSLTFTNVNLLWLYKSAFGDGFTTYYQQNRISLEVKHPEEFTSHLTGAAYLEWLMKPGHGACYELKLPAEKANQLFPMFRYNLAMLFPQYNAVIEKRNVKSIALRMLPGQDKIKTTHTDGEVVEIFDPFGFTLQNSPLNTLLGRMQLQFQQSSNIPFINETGYTGRVDLKIAANLSSVADMNRALKPYNLQWEERLVPLDILVIKDADKNN